MRNTMSIFVLSLASVAFLASCKDPVRRNSFDAYQKGVSLSLDAARYIEEGNIEEGKKLYQQSIVNFKKSWTIDSTNYGAVSAIGYNLHELGNFKEAMSWLHKAVKVQPELAVNYQLLGLSQVNEGYVDEGEANIAKAFEMDGSDEMRSMTIQNLVQIGTKAFSYGLSLENPVKATNYKNYGKRTMIAAFELSDRNKSIGEIIDNFAAESNDERLSKWVREIIYPEQNAANSND